MAEWISVRDRKPKAWERVLVYRADGFIDFDLWHGDMWNYDFECDAPVTHWMPLEPPKEDV